MKITLHNIQDIYKAKKVSIETMELKGYKLIENLFVDNSRMGADDEPALTVSQFETRVRAILAQYGQVNATITGEGQFQVYIGLFTKVGSSKMKQIGNNTYSIDLENGSYAIRLHDTDIITYNRGLQIITLDSGGYETLTTKRRMNEFLAQYNIHVQQEAYQWKVYSKPDAEGKYQNVKLFRDGMTIQL